MSRDMQMFHKLNLGLVGELKMMVGMIQNAEKELGVNPFVTLKSIEEAKNDFRIGKEKVSYEEVLEIIAQN